MNTIKIILVLFVMGLASISFSQNEASYSSTGSNFKIAIAPTVGYISFDQPTDIRFNMPYNIDNFFMGGQLAISSEKTTLKKRYLRNQFSYMYHIKRIGDHDLVNNHYITYNPEYFFRLKDKFELGAGVSFGMTSQGYKLPGTNGGVNYSNFKIIKGLSLTGIYNMSRIFTSMSLSYNKVGGKFSDLTPVESRNKNAQVLFRIGYKL